MDWPSSSPVELRQGLDVGGGRGVFAKQALRAGQLLLVESPLVCVPNDKAPDESLHVSLARALLQSPDRDQLLVRVATLHPMRLQDIPDEGLQRARQHYKGDVDRLMQAASLGQGAWEGAGAGVGVGQGAEAEAPGQGTGEGAAAAAAAAEEKGQGEGMREGAVGVPSGGVVTCDEVLRLILAVQCNAFYSGFYLKCSMFNHCCNPSCIKLARPDGTSEVRALRNLEAGEECTISYLAPPLQSFPRRVRHLQEQHYFILPPPSAFPPEGDELACSSVQQLPPSCLQLLLTPIQIRIQTTTAVADHGDAPAGAAVTGELEPKTGEDVACAGLGGAESVNSVESVAGLVEGLEDRLDEMEAWLHSVNEGQMPPLEAQAQAGAAGAGAAGAAAGASGTATGGKAAREQRRRWQHEQAVALLATAENLRGAGEKVAGSCHVALIRLDSLTLSAARLALLCAPDPCGEEALEAALKLVGVAGRLKAAQEQVLGLDHHDLIATLESLHKALGFLLSNAPKQLFAAHPAWGSFPKASVGEAQAKKRCKLLQAAYSS